MRDCGARARNKMAALNFFVYIFAKVDPLTTCAPNSDKEKSSIHSIKNKQSNRHPHPNTKNNKRQTKTNKHPNKQTNKKQTNILNVISYGYDKMVDIIFFIIVTILRP